MHSTVSKVCVGNSMLECAEKKGGNEEEDRTF